VKRSSRTPVSPVLRERERYKRTASDPKKRKVLLDQWGRDLLTHWLTQWHPLLVATKDGRALVGGADAGIVADFRWDDLRKRLSATDFALVERLYHELARQAQVASIAVEVAETKIANVKQNARAGAVRGAESVGDNRAKVERAMRTILRQGGDPRDYFQTWADEFGYTVRHLRNILKSERGKQQR
jgi:hypothetical protein